MEKEYIFGRVEQSMREIGWVDKNKEKGDGQEWEENIMKANGKMEKQMGMEF